MTASSTPTSTLTWISWFCSLPGHEYFCEVSEEFIEDDFNLTGLNTMVPFWKEAMEMVLDIEGGDPARQNMETRIIRTDSDWFRRGCFKNTRCLDRRVVRRNAVRSGAPTIHPDPSRATGHGRSPISVDQLASRPLTSKPTLHPGR
jgi:hypothetical protein